MGIEKIIKAEQEVNIENLSKENIEIIADFVKKFAIFLEENPDIGKDYDSLRENGFLGNGGAGSVFSLNQNICFKTMPNRPTDTNYNKYDIEALTLKRLNGLKLNEEYKNLIRTPYFFTYYRTLKNREILMERIKGVNFQEVVNGTAKLPEKFYENFFINGTFDADKVSDVLGDFLDLIHAKGVVHNDIALRNLMVDENGFLVLIDTGQSIFIDGFGKEDKNQELKKDDDAFDELIEELENFFDGVKIKWEKEQDIQIRYNYDDTGNIETEIFPDEIIILAKKLLNNNEIKEKVEIKKGLYLTPFKKDLILGIKKINFNGVDYYLGFLKD